MRIPARLGDTCAADDCTDPAEIAGWCPAHAIARYRRQALRPTPARWLKGYAGPTQTPVDVQRTDDGD